MHIKNYDEALQYIHGRSRFKKTPTLSRMKFLAEKLGNPQNKFKTLHVTGTNGKGSTTAFLRELLRGQGFTVGTFTSPYITRFNERISVDGKMISDDEIVRLVNIVYPIVQEMDEIGMCPTEFEIITTMMFVYFGERHADYVVVEVGMGGLYDSTNIITPLVSVITTVALDHSQWLGNSISQIAYQKAGIIKKKIPIVVGRVPNEAYDVIKNIALEKDADLYCLNNDFSTQALSQKKEWGEFFNYRFQQINYKNLCTGLLGAFQIDNAACALTAFLIVARKEKFIVQINDIRKALMNTKWPGRFEKINSEPLIVLDGAHNVAAIEKIQKLLRQKFKQQKIYVLLAILADKKSTEMIEKLSELSNTELIITSFDGPRKVTDLENIKQTFPEIKSMSVWQEAFLKIVKGMSAEDMLLITGSLYFISEVRNYFLDSGE